MSEQERKETQLDAPSAYPLIALKNMVVFPRTRMTLSIAREKSVRAVEEAMMQPEHLLIAASQRDPEIDDPQPKDIYTTGALVEIATIHQQDGSMQILLNGLRRVEINEYLDQEPFLRVSVNVPQEPQPRGPQTDAVVRHAISLFEHYAQLNRRFSVEDITSIVGIKAVARLSDMLAAHVVTEPSQQQDLLETLDPLDRLEKICVIIGNEIEILELEATIRSRVRSQVDRTQKEFYLREQLRAIQEELGLETTSEANDLRMKLKEKLLPPDVATKVRKEIDRLERTPPQSAEIAVLRSYIDWVLVLPWTEYSNDSFDIERTRRILDEDHYGLEGIKERIIEFLVVRHLRQRVASRGGASGSGSQGQILCFIGPPGIGKTSLARSIARALGRKFARIALGGVHDEAEIRGHRRTYVGALPGRIIQSMKTVGVRNPVFLLDEIDKISSDYRGDPGAALLEVLDPEQNSTFTDNYLDIPYDLSEVFFICTGNVKYQIPRVLADRMDIIDLPGYILEEKVNIGLHHLLPKVLSEHGLSPAQLKIPQSVMQYIVTGYTREAGVRSLERQLATICRKTARLIMEKPDTHLRITARKVEQYLGAPHYNNEAYKQKMQVGAALGLAVTESGGMLLPVEVATMVGKGELIFTGQLGDVMRESVMAALSYIRSRAQELQIDPNFLDTTDLHIHLPENSLPKDGPSAGITIATGIVSALTKRRVRGDIAMTGEITLHGRVLAVGGLREKVLAAHYAQLRHLLIPAENEKDLAEIPAKIRQDIRFTLVDNIDQVFEAVLLDAPLPLEKQPEDEQTEQPQEPRPIKLATPSLSPTILRRRISVDENGEEQDEDEHPPLILPPKDRIAGDSYSQLQARDNQDS